MGKLLRVLATVACVACPMVGAARADASSVLVMERSSDTVVRSNPYLPAAGVPDPGIGLTSLGSSLTSPGNGLTSPASGVSEPSSPAAKRPAPPRVLTNAISAAKRPPAKPKPKPAPPEVTIGTVLAKLHANGQISDPTYTADNGILQAAISTAARLKGTRATELYAVLTNMHRMALAGQIIPSRLPALFLTLANNRRWWSTGPLLASGQRVQFSGSQLVWEYYPGQGIELQQLGSFGEADGLYTAGPAAYPKLRSLLAELIPLAVNRAGGLAWEYYFRFDGGSPPWVSAMTQGTALEAFSRAYKAFGDSSYLQIAQQALPLFSAPPPVGVRVSAPHGSRYLQYSFAPGASIINAFLQSLIGLYDYSRTSQDQTAQQLFDAGNAEAMAEVPSFNTGAWSLYQPGEEDTLSYHQLVTGFLQELCSRTGAPVYCNTGTSFQLDLKTPPALHLITTHSRVGATTDVHFWLSKRSHVGIVELLGGKQLFATSTVLGYGTRALALPAPRRPGAYTVRLAATDLAGNFSRTVGTLQVAPRPKRVATTPKRH